MKMLLCTVTIVASTLIAPDAGQQQISKVPSFTPALSQTFSLDLDSASGVYSMWRHHDLGSLSALRATIRIPVIRKDSKWAPAFSLWVNKNESGRAVDSVGVQFLSLGHQVPLAIRFVQVQAGQLTTTENSRQTVNLGESISVEVVWAAPNIVGIKIGDSESHSVSVPWSIGSIEFAASTGQMKVDPVVFGTEVQ